MEALEPQSTKLKFSDLITNYADRDKHNSNNY